MISIYDQLSYCKELNNEDIRYCKKSNYIYKYR